MGVDLTLGISPWRSDWDGANPIPLLMTMLLVPRCREAWDEVQVISVPWNREVDWYFDTGLKRTRVDAYGEALTYALPGNLVRVFRKFNLHECGEVGRCAVAYLEALDPDHKIFLWWH